MTKTDLTRFRSTLGLMYAELETGNRKREALVVETSPDELDRIQHASNRDEAMRMLERNTNRLGEVTEALQRIEEGKYGICAECDGSINPKRLAAIPWASLCVSCQETADNEHENDFSEMDTEFVLAA